MLGILQVLTLNSEESKFNFASVGAVFCVPSPNYGIGNFAYCVQTSETRYWTLEARPGLRKQDLVRCPREGKVRI